MAWARKSDISSKRCLLVAAIDVGHTYSNYAFSSIRDYNADPLNSRIPNWTDHRKMPTAKVITCVLFDKNGRFDSFGYEADDKYHGGLCETGEADKWYFYTKFMNASELKKADGTFFLQDVTGKTLPAVTVYSAVIRYLSQRCLENIRDVFHMIVPSYIAWVITVPVIWPDTQVQLMQEAASQAGIDHNKLTLVSRPEVAAVCCHMEPQKSLRTAEGSMFFTTSEPTKYMVVSAEDESTDITVFWRRADGFQKVLYKTSGQAFGGKSVNQEFCNMLTTVFGAHVYTEFCKVRDENADLHNTLDIKKRLFKQSYKDFVNLLVPSSIFHLTAEITKKTVKNLIENSQISGIKYRNNCVIAIFHEIFSDFFKPAINSIVTHIADVCQNELVQDTKVLLLVGEFAECEMVQTAIRAAFPNVDVVVPSPLRFSTLIGAVAYGHGYRLQEPVMVSIGA